MLEYFIIKIAKIYLKYSGYENKYLIYNKDTFFMEKSKKYF